MNKERLEQIIANFEAIPQKLRMEDWFEASSDAPCGTTKCIGGEAIINYYGETHQVSHPLEYDDVEKIINETNIEIDPDLYEKFSFAPASSKYLYHPEDKAAFILDIDKHQARRLFFVNSWPEPYKSDYNNTLSQVKKVEATIARIRKFIETDGAE